MIKITVKELKIQELEVLQNELELYVNYISNYVLKNDFLNAIISLDIANNLYFILRSRIENGRTSTNINFTVSQAATIVKCCKYQRPNRNEYVKNVLLQLSATIDQQLISLV